MFHVVPSGRAGIRPGGFLIMQCSKCNGTGESSPPFAGYDPGVCLHCGGSGKVDRIEFTILGTPIGKPRMTRRDKWHKRPATTRYWLWKAGAKRASGRLPETSQIARLDWTAYFPPPHRWSYREKLAAIGKPHRARPDRDNIDKAILDALFDEDSGIACGTISKVWGTPARVEVVITLLD